MTKRFLLRDFCKADEPAFFAYHADPKYAEFCTLAEVAPSHTRKLLHLFSQWAVEYPRCNYQLAVIDRRKLPDLVGCCGLRRQDFDADLAELGIELAPQFWGRYGYAIEIASALIEFGFCDLGLKEMRGISVSANLRVTRLAQQYGFVEIGAPPARTHERGWHQTEWQLTRESWQRFANH